MLCWRIKYDDDDDDLYRECNPAGKDVKARNVYGNVLVLQS